MYLGNTASTYETRTSASSASRLCPAEGDKQFGDVLMDLFSLLHFEQAAAEHVLVVPQMVDQRQRGKQKQHWRRGHYGQGKGTSRTSAPSDGQTAPDPEPHRVVSRNRKTAAALDHCLNMIPEELAKILMEKLEQAKIRLRDAKPLEVRIKKTRALVARKIPRMKSVDGEFKRLVTERATITQIIAHNQEVLLRLRAHINSHNNPYQQYKPSANSCRTSPCRKMSAWR